MVQADQQALLYRQLNMPHGVREGGRKGEGRWGGTGALPFKAFVLCTDLQGGYGRIV